MDKGQSVFRGHGFISATKEPYAYVERAVATEIVSDGVTLVRIDAYSGTRLEPAIGWHEDEREAWRVALAELDAAADEFFTKLHSKRMEIAAKVAGGVQA